jgi:tryptophan halogenase
MKICIVGGGSAGWLAALILSKTRPQNEYTLIESSKLGIIGVGEGTTAMIRYITNNPFFGISELEFIKETDALPKHAIRFENWNKDKTTFDIPLEGTPTASHYIDVYLYSALLNNIPIEYAAETSTATYENKTLYKLKDRIDGTKELVLDASTTAWHFDAHKFGKYLQKVCDRTNSVKHIDSEVDNISTDGDKVTSLTLANGQTIEADLFIDCSGFSRILSKATGQQTVSYNDTLPLDRAYMFKLEEDPMEKLPVTKATAVDNGWIFEIPTRNRNGRGYIYSSKFATEEEINAELEKIYGTKVNKVKVIEFETSRVEKTISGNVFCVGLASCFFEPLQATSIHCTILQLLQFVHTVLTDNIETTLNKTSTENYNKFVNLMYDDIADFIGLHYEGGREDTPFWSWVTNEKPKSAKVKEILELTKTRLSRSVDFTQYHACPGPNLYNYVLAGLGYYPKEKINEIYKLWNINDPEFMLMEFVPRNQELSNKCVTNITPNQFNEYIKGLL